MKWLTVVIKYRLWIGIVLLALAIFTNVQAGFWPSFVLYLLAVILIVGHFVFGPMRLIQECMETGDMEGAKKVLGSIWFPALLIKPIRSVYYTVKGNLDMVDQDFAGAEKNLKISQKSWILCLAEWICFTRDFKGVQEGRNATDRRSHATCTTCIERF